MKSWSDANEQEAFQRKLNFKRTRLPNTYSNWLQLASAVARDHSNFSNGIFCEWTLFIGTLSCARKFMSKYSTGAKNWVVKQKTVASHVIIMCGHIRASNTSAIWIHGNSVSCNKLEFIELRLCDVAHFDWQLAHDLRILPIPPDPVYRFNDECNAIRVNCSHKGFEMLTSKRKKLH